jgi:hypothetical protein
MLGRVLFKEDTLGGAIGLKKMVYIRIPFKPGRSQPQLGTVAEAGFLYNIV